MNLFQFIIAALLICVSYPLQAATNVQVYFSPKGDCTAAVNRELDAAKTNIFVQAYSFTSGPIAKALVDAHKRGVKVWVVLDKSQKSEKYSSADFLKNARIETHINSAHAIAHNKVMIIEQQTVITGSFNFSKAAEEKNAENLLVIHERGLASAYLENWKNHFDHAVAYTSKVGRADQELSPLKKK